MSLYIPLSSSSTLSTWRREEELRKPQSIANNSEYNNSVKNFDLTDVTHREAKEHVNDEICKLETVTSEKSYLLRRGVRSVVCGLLFAAPIAFLVPHSPAMMLSAQDTQRRVLTIRIINDFFRLCLCTGALSYCFLVEPFAHNALIKKSFIPYLGPITAQIPALSCLCISHLYFPGLAALLYESNWCERFRVSARLNFKCFLAYFTIHVPCAIAIGCVVGSLMLPFKLYKNYRNRSIVALNTEH